MRINRIAQVGALAAVAALALTSCAANEQPTGDTTTGGSELTGMVDATGASSQAAAQQAWIAEFQTANPDVTINYQPTGSGTGRDNFIAGSSAFIGSDRAFNDEEIAEGDFAGCVTPDIVEIPVYISPVALVFNLEGVDSLNLSPETIAHIFNRQITTWNDPAIAADNPDADLPDLDITPVFRGDSSGTTGTFTAYLASVAPDAWPYEDGDEWPVTTDPGESAQQTSGVETAVSNGNGTIGYLDASRAGSLGSVAIGVGSGFVPFSSEAASELVASSPLVEGRGAGDLVFDVDPADAPEGSYPIALVSYLIACEQYEDAATADVIREYFTYIASEAGQEAAAAAAGSAPISDDLRSQVNDAVALIGSGS